MMSDMIMVYITCENIDQAKELSKRLLSKKLCACVNIFPEVQPMFLWPPKSGIIDESREIVVIAKTIESKYQQLEDEIHAGNPGTPCVFAIPITHVAPKYYTWLTGELED